MKKAPHSRPGALAGSRADDSTDGAANRRRKGAETGGNDQASFSDSAPVASSWIGRTLAG